MKKRKSEIAKKKHEKPRVDVTSLELLRGRKNRKFGEATTEAAKQSNEARHKSATFE